MKFFIQPLRNYTYTLLSVCLFLFQITVANSSSSIDCEQLYNKLDVHLSVFNNTVKPSSVVFNSLAESVSHNNRSHSAFVLIEGVKVPRISANSKWRARIITAAENDFVDKDGYLSGWDRKGDNIGNGLAAKYNHTNTLVNYSFADGRVVKVSGKEARALEFSYLDKLNPKSPSNTIVVGIHDDPEHILQLVRQGSAELLRDPKTYIRLDEISIDGLVLTSAEELYQKFRLHNPNYSPVGEYVSDRSIPVTNILSSHKFQSIKSTKSLDELKTVRFHVGQKISYVALSGKKYQGVVAEKKVIDDHLIIFYIGDDGSKKYDLAKIDTIELGQ